MIPSMFLGALRRPPDQAATWPRRSAELTASGISNPKVKLEFPSDLTSTASRSASSPRRSSPTSQAGIKVDLAGAPIATSLNELPRGHRGAGLWYWGPDYPDPNDYLVFLPGQLVGLRAGWAAGADPTLETLGVKAARPPTRCTRGALQADPATA